MVADRLILLIVFIDFCLQIASYDCNILLSAIIDNNTAAKYCGFTDYCNYIYTSAIYIWVVDLYQKNIFPESNCLE